MSTSIPPIQPAQTDAATRATLDAFKAKLGSTPNMFLTMAQTPVALNAYVQLADVTARGTLNAKQREQIELAVGDANAATTAWRRTAPSARWPA